MASSHLRMLSQNRRSRWTFVSSLATRFLIALMLARSYFTASRRRDPRRDGPERGL